MQPSGINMGLIREALARRQAGGTLGGGNSMPAASQLTAGGTSTMGSPQTQQPPVQQQPTASISQLPTQVKQSSAPNNEPTRAGQLAQGPQFDEETRSLAKSLVQKLLKGL